MAKKMKKKASALNWAVPAALVLALAVGLISLILRDSGGASAAIGESGKPEIVYFYSAS